LRALSIQGPLSVTYKSLKSRQPSYLRSPHSFPSRSSLITLIALLSPLVLKLQTYHFIILFVFCGTVSRLIYIRHLAHHVTPSHILNSRASDLSTFIFLKKFKTYLFHCSSPPYSVYLFTLISSVVSKLRCFISYSFRYYSPELFMPIYLCHLCQFIFYLTCPPLCLCISSH